LHDAKATEDEVKKESVDPAENLKKDVRCIKYELENLERKAKKTVIFVVPKVISPAKRGANISAESKYRVFEGVHRFDRDFLKDGIGSMATF
jgi:hypothetical protein